MDHARIQYSNPELLVYLRLLVHQPPSCARVIIIVICLPHSLDAIDCALHMKMHDDAGERCASTKTLPRQMPNASNMQSEGSVRLQRWYTPVLYICNQNHLKHFQLRDSQRAIRKRVCSVKRKKMERGVASLSTVV